MRIARVAAVAVVATLAVLLVVRIVHRPKSIAVGKVVPAPAFDLARLTGGGRLRLAAYRGKAVVLNFWASDCHPCKKEMPQLQQASQRWRGKAVVLGIDVLDFRGPARAFVRTHGVSYPIGFDGVGDTAIRYGVSFTPTTFFIDRRGRIVHRVLGPMTDSELDAQIAHASAS